MFRKKIVPSLVLLTFLLSACSSEELSPNTNPETTDIVITDTEVFEEELQEPQVEEAKSEIELKKEEFEGFYQNFMGYTVHFAQLQENMLETRNYILENPNGQQGLEYQLTCLDQMSSLLLGFSQLSPPEELSVAYELFQSTCTSMIHVVKACQESLTEDISLEDLADIPDYQHIVLDYVDNYESFAKNLILLCESMEKTMEIYF